MKLNVDVSEMILLPDFYCIENACVRECIPFIHFLNLYMVAVN